MRRQVAAYAIFAGIVLSCLSAWPGSPVPIWTAGLCLWGGALLLAANVASRNLRQSLVLMAVGLAGIGYGALHGQPLTLETFLSANVSLVGMVAAVSFLALIAPTSAPARQPGQGRSIFTTLLGVHLFGSVINMSAAFIFGDRMAAGGKLNLGQSLILSRASSLGAFWSPFYAAMAVGLSVAPHANVFQVMLTGIPLAILGMGLSFWQLQHNAESMDIQGVPVSFAALALPMSMAAAVLLLHHFYPPLPILTLITLLAPLMAVMVGLHRSTGQVRVVVQRVSGHIEDRLPRMVNEILLFLSAGLLTQGGKAVIAGLGDWRLFDSFAGMQAVIMYLAIVASSLLGLHPIIGISMFAAMLNGLDVDPSLLALVSICSWAVGTAVGPLSGINLALYGRYGIDTYQITRHTLLYALAMSVLVSVMLLLVS